MTTLLTLTFQGKAQAVGHLDAADERQAARAAFLLTPPRDATRDDFLAFKMTPLESGRTLLSAIRNRGDQDPYGRPVLRATGCVLEPAELTGALRDPAAVWQALADLALADLDPGPGMEGFERRVAELSIHTSASAFEEFRGALERSWDFHARLATTLDTESVDVYLDAAPAAAPKLLRPALGLLPASRLRKLDIAIGGEPSEVRESVLGLPGSAPRSARAGRGMLSKLLPRKKDDLTAAVTVDLRDERVYGHRSRGPVELAQAIVDPLPWPVALAEQDRYQVLLECLDEGRSLFEILPELDELRQAVRRLEALSKAVAA